MLYRVGGEKWINYTLEADFCYTDGNVGWGGIVYNHWGFKKLQKASFSGSTSKVTVALNGMNSKWTNNESGVNSKTLTNENTKAIVSGAPFRMKIVSHFESASLYYAMLNDDGTMKTDWIFVMSIDNIAEGAQQGSIGLMTSAGANVTSFWVDNVKCYANVYSEDFSYDDTGLTANEINTEMGLQYVKTSADGVAEIKNGALYMSRGDAVSEKKGLFDAVLFTEGTRWTDYVLEADYTYLMNEHSAWSGLAYRAVDVANFQKAALTPFNSNYPNGLAVLNGMKDGAWYMNDTNYTFASLSGNSVELNQPFRLRVTVVGSVAQLFVAYYDATGELGSWSFVHEIRDRFADVHAGGTFGLIVGGSRTTYKTSVCIDNLTARFATEKDLWKEIYYEETFSYEDTALTPNETNAALGLQYIKTSNNGVAEIRDGALYMSRGDSDSVKASRFDAVLFTAGTEWTDYSVEADYTYLVKESNAWSGLLYRATDIENFQKAALTPHLSSYPDGVAVLNGQKDGTWYKNDTAITFSEYDASRVELGKPVRLKVVAVGGTAQLFVGFYDENGVLGDWNYVMQITDRFDAVHMKGTVGLVVGGSRTNYATAVCIDNVVVRTATEEDLYVKPDYTTEVYEPESGIVNPPVVVQTLTSTLPANTGERPAVLLMNVDASMNVLGGDGTVLTTVEALVDDYRTALLPAFIVDGEAEADALAALILEKELSECYVVADAANAGLVHRVRVKNSVTELITGALLFDDLSTPEAREEARYLIVENMSFVAISRAPLSEETARYFNSRQIAAWGTAADDAGVYQGIANGYHGIVSENTATVYDVYESITTPTVSGKPIIISHRGENKLNSKTRHPENTVSAIKAAKDVYRADGVEIDLKMTKDGYLVLMHDADVDRTTNGTGNVADLTLAEIKALNVDYLAGKTEKVPTFEEILAVIKDKDIVLYCHIATVTDAILASASYLIDQYDCRDNVVLFLNHNNRTIYNASNTATYSSTAYGFVDHPVALDGMMYVLGGDKYITKSLTSVSDGLKVLRETTVPYNYQPFFYPYSKNAVDTTLWDTESFYYQTSARGFVNSHSVTNYQESLDFYLLTGVGAVGILTDGTGYTDDYHYAIESGKTYFALGEALELTKTVKLNLGTTSAPCGFIQLAGPALEATANGYTLNRAGRITLVYYVDRVANGGASYRVYSEPVTLTFAEEALFTGAKLNLGADLSMLYYVTVNDPTLLERGLAVRFTFCGKEILVTEYREIDGEYVFTLSGIAPQQIGDEITATLLADGTEITSHSGYSAKKNLTNLLSKDAKTLGISEQKLVAMKTLISDLLVYADAAQDYVSYKPELPILDGSEQIAPSTVAPTKSDGMELFHHVDPLLCFKSATVHFNTVNEIRIKLFVGDIDASLVSVNIDGATLALADLKALGSGCYLITIPELLATELDTVHVIKLSYNGVEGASLCYSAYAYAYEMQNSESANMKALALALYRYGISADAYASLA